MPEAQRTSRPHSLGVPQYLKHVVKAAAGSQLMFLKPVVLLAFNAVRHVGVRGQHCTVLNMDAGIHDFYSVI